MNLFINLISSRCRAIALTKVVRLCSYGIVSSALMFSSLTILAQPVDTTIKQVVSEQVNKAIDINSASAKQLAKTLKGIGKVKANAIVAYRTANGAFDTVDDLVKVKGISTKLIERNRHLIEATPLTL